MTLRVKFPDPRKVALGILRAEPTSTYGATVKFGTVFPEERKQAAQGLPYVRVSVDSRSGFYPVTATAALRVQVWAASEDKAQDLAELLKAVLLSNPGDANQRGCSEGVGPLPATDPESGSPFAYFTAALRLRPTPL
ncbi:hypothetical protein HPO96_36980 [Kribbella sandramycini]|uniref:DUF3168 domain-containing protein n=1 Tax=Kribbella sandramycini TaxID=60450 RepID=A0A7Y4L7L7_9ACTN|nr:hypothetical protein [Kribbella sandramycini]MBB6564391.1 hypothetical protein [Kribbella sandramycini]NOL45854.1 hypothetical protein [Kribbella sandramycini]